MDNIHDVQDISAMHDGLVPDVKDISATHAGLLHGVKDLVTMAALTAAFRKKLNIGF